MKGVWLLAFLVNLFLLFSVFDIHFKSPIVNVTTTHKSYHENSFPRVVFFVADGLRADTFFQNEHRRPYLTEVMERNNCVFGISDTRVPTESRPGHIALFAGFYEDPSAVFTGWKKNLVEFDSVFNRSQTSVALGSPDIIDMFAEGVAKSKMYSETYSTDWQDFLQENSSLLDTWVFDRFQNLAQHNKLPRNDGSILFLHLLGIDNTGHATKPHSEEYLAGLTLVDEIVKKVKEIVKKYYKDERTLFVFTSDHGMTDWGSHGSGSIEETETPIVIWGPGVKKSSDIRIRQADITPLVAGALGISFPTNSIGKFPHNIWTDKHFAYSNLRSNLLQVLELSRTKKALAASERNLPFLEFANEVNVLKSLEDAEKIVGKKLEKAVEKKLEKAIALLESAFSEVLLANEYYERYNQFLMIIYSVLGFVFLMIFIGFSILHQNFAGKSTGTIKDVFIPKVGICAFGLAFLLTKIIIGWSIFRIFYSLIPFYLLLLITNKFLSAVPLLKQRKKLLWSFFLSVIGVQLLVLSFWERSVLSFVLIFNFLWALWSLKSKIGIGIFEKGMEICVHLIIVGTLSIFPAVPILGRELSPFFTTLGPLLSAIIGLLGVFLTLTPSAAVTMEYGGQAFRDRCVLVMQTVMIILVSVLSHVPTFIITRIYAWQTLGGTMVIPMMTGPGKIVIRLTSIFLALGVPYAFLGVNYETLFFPFLFLTLLIFLKVEIEEQTGSLLSWGEFLSLDKEDERIISGKETRQFDVHRAFRRAWFHIFFVLLSFFGTGNIGSLSSFDPSSTRCFVSVFNPWIMMVLMLAKILIPILLVSAFWRALLPSSQAVERNFGILLLLCQGMSLTMFFKVTNQGSWLEIGMSISQFVIVQVTTLFLLVFHFIADFLVTADFTPRLRLPTTLLPSSYQMKEKDSSKSS